MRTHRTYSPASLTVKGMRADTLAAFVFATLEGWYRYPPELAYWSEPLTNT
jgi:hypothetical protein